MMKTITLTLLAFLAATAKSSAQIHSPLTMCPVPANTATGPSPALTTGATASALTRRAGLGFATAANSFNSNTWNMTNTFETSTATGKYIDFHVTSRRPAESTFSNLAICHQRLEHCSEHRLSGLTPLMGARLSRLGTTANGGAYHDAQRRRATAQPPLGISLTPTLASAATARVPFLRVRCHQHQRRYCGRHVATTRIANMTGLGNPQYDLVVNGPVTLVQAVNAPELPPWRSSPLPPVCWVWGFTAATVSPESTLFCSYQLQTCIAVYACYAPGHCHPNSTLHGPSGYFQLTAMVKKTTRSTMLALVADHGRR